MKKIISYIKKWKLSQILTVFLVGIILMVTTACNRGDVRGARPENPPVQLGGQNNPHKAGGDGYTKYKASPDPKADPQAFDFRGQLIAQQAPEAPSERKEKMLYKTNTKVNKEEIPVVNAGEDQLKEVPAERQKVIERSNPDENILEKTGEAFKESTRFFREGIDKAFDENE
jgi:hypothetical protein